MTLTQTADRSKRETCAQNQSSFSSFAYEINGLLELEKT